MRRKSKTHQSLRPAHAFSVEQKSLVIFDEALEFRSIRGVLNVAAVLAFPVREVGGSAECIVKTANARVALASENRFVITAEVIHLIG